MYKVTTLVSLVIALSSADPTHPQQHEYTHRSPEHAVSSQSYTRGDVPLSYKYEAVHIYSTPKPGSQKDSYSPIVIQKESPRTEDNVFHNADIEGSIKYKQALEPKQVAYQYAPIYHHSDEAETGHMVITPPSHEKEVEYTYKFFEPQDAMPVRDSHEAIQYSYVQSDTFQGHTAPQEASVNAQSVYAVPTYSYTSRNDKPAQALQFALSTQSDSQQVNNYQKPTRQQEYVPSKKHEYVPSKTQEYVVHSRQPEYQPSKQQEYVPSRHQEYVPSRHQEYIPSSQQEYVSNERKQQKFSMGTVPYSHAYKQPAEKYTFKVNPAVKKPLTKPILYKNMASKHAPLSYPFSINSDRQSSASSESQEVRRYPNHNHPIFRIQHEDPIHKVRRRSYRARPMKYISMRSMYKQN